MPGWDSMTCKVNKETNNHLVTFVGDILKLCEIGLFTYSWLIFSNGEQCLDSWIRGFVDLRWSVVKRVVARVSIGRGPLLRILIDRYQKQPCSVRRPRMTLRETRRVR
jgi:hypothetical protein